MNLKRIIKDITSRNSHKVWSASCEIISHSQDVNAIKQLIEFLPLIQEKTKGLDMGGLFAPNQRFIDFAIRIIQFHRDIKECSCRLYTEHGFNPNEEAKKGNIQIIDTILESNWIDFYIAECKKCGQKFKILERESHYTWWAWSLI